MQRWYVASTHPKAESFSRDNLNDQGFETFLPMKTDRRVIRRKLCYSTNPLFPSYLFIRFDREIDRWRSVNGTRGIQRLISSGISDNPLPLPVGVVEDIQIRQASGEFGPKPEEKQPAILAGQMVRIVNGPLSDFEGICLMSRTERVRVLLSFLGRTSSVELRADQVIAA